MIVVTMLWCMNAAIALTLAAACLLFWTVERRDLTYFAFAIVATATAVSIPFELGMMRAATPAEYGELLRLYHLPVFVVLVGYPFFVRSYLGTGRLWLLWTVVGFRVATLAINFIVDPNINFRQITSLSEVPFLGEQVTVVGSGLPGPWQWLASVGVLLLIAFVIDAAIQRYRQGDPESRRKASVMALAILVPLLSAMVMNLMVVNGIVRFPVSNTLWFLGTLSVIGYELGREVVISRRAKVQLARLREEIVQFDRVNTLGHFASGLAHELLQPLGATAGNAGAAELLLRQPAPDLAQLREIVGDIQKETERAAEIIRHMRVLIERRAPGRRLVDIQQLVRDVLLLAAPEAAASHVDLASRVQPGLPRAFCDPVQISQVLLNLLFNGMDAVKARADDARLVRIEAVPDTKGGVEIDVVDSGTGIADGKMEEVFSPLYTTKTNGLGMGLAISRTIVEAHGGRLSAMNNVSAGGATFRFNLPSA